MNKNRNGAQDQAIENTDQIIEREVRKVLADVAAGRITSARFDEIVIALAEVHRLSR
jgi:hypothetical protein